MLWEIRSRPVITVPPGLPVKHKVHFADEAPARLGA